jgi:hypothetical protein
VQHFGYQWIINVIVALGHRRGGLHALPQKVAQPL